MPVPPGAGICVGRWLRLGVQLRHNARTDLRVVRPAASAALAVLARPRATPPMIPAATAGSAMQRATRRAMCVLIS